MQNYAVNMYVLYIQLDTLPTTVGAAKCTWMHEWKVFFCIIEYILV